MPKVKLDGVHKVTAKGRSYWYAWRGAGAPRLKGEPGSAEFVSSLEAAHAGRRSGDRTKVSGLVIAYKRDPAWQELAEKTRANWAPWLDRIVAHFGELRIAAFDRPLIRVAIKRWRDQYRATPRSADVGLQVLSRVLSFAVENGDLGTNPVAGIPHLYSANRAEVIWTADDLEQLAAHASPEVMWAARLAVLTGLRQADLLRLSWSHVKANSIEIRTGKSGGTKTTLIPIHAALRAQLDAIPRLATTVLTNSEGRPWRTGFGSSWNKAVTRAGIDKHFHDLRGTAATALYRAGFTSREIADVMTWSQAGVEQLVDRYVKRDELILDRIRRLDQTSGLSKTGKVSNEVS